MDISKLQIGTPIRIKTDDDIYDSYISAITIRDENYVYFKSGTLRVTLLDKLKKESSTNGNKLDVSGGVIKGNININGNILQNGESYLEKNIKTADYTFYITPSTSRGSSGYGETTVDISNINFKKILAITFYSSSNYVLWGLYSNNIDSSSSLNIYGYRIIGTYASSIGGRMRITYI